MHQKQNLQNDLFTVGQAETRNVLMWTVAYNQ